MVTMIGNTRHRGVDAFLASLLFTPIVGVIWVLAMPDPTDKICPICKELVKKDALKCKHCGAGLANPQEQQVDESGEVKERIDPGKIDLDKLKDY